MHEFPKKESSSKLGFLKLGLVHIPSRNDMVFPKLFWSPLDPLILVWFSQNPFDFPSMVLICSTEKMETTIQYSSANLCIPQMLEGKHYLLILGLISSLLYVLIVLDGKQDKFRIPTSQF